MFIVEPQAPTFQAIQDGDVTEDTITVRWNAPASGADTYELAYEITLRAATQGTHSQASQLPVSSRNC